MALQCRVHQLRTAAALGGGFADRQRQRRHPQPLSLDDVGWRQVASPSADTVPTPAVAVSGHRHLNGFWGELRETVPPCGGQSAGRCLATEGQHCCTYSRGICKRTIVNEVHATRALPPTS